jgi:signal transduction histidine kinase
MHAYIQRIPDLFRARLSQKIVTTIFLSIVAIETIILIPSVYQREQELLDRLEEVSSSKVTGLLLADPELNRNQDQLLSLLLSLPKLPDSNIMGGAVYDLQGRLITHFGEPPALQWPEIQRFNSRKAHKLDRYTYRYDAEWDLSNYLSYETIVLRHDARWVRTEYLWYIARIAGLVLIISIVVTASTIIALDRLLIAPILALRQDLLIAGDVFKHNDPDTHPPEFASVQLCRDDELGDVARAFVTMVNQITSGINELQRTQLQLVHSEKMSSLGQLVAGIAHEINNPINFIYGNITYVNDCAQDLLSAIAYYHDDRLAKVTKPNDASESVDATQQSTPRSPNPHNPSTTYEPPDPEELAFLIEDLPKVCGSIRIGAERVRDIVLSLRNFARLDEAELKPVNIHEGLDNALLLLGYRLEATQHHSTIHVERNYDELPNLECYPGQLNQALLNLLLNAIESFDTDTDTDHAQSAITPKITLQTRHIDANHIAILIRDTGKGMTPELQAKIFDPFFTTKPIGRNKGLGLSIAERIITVQHNGTIQIESSPDSGTEVTITLPTQHRLASY